MDQIPVAGLLDFTRMQHIVGFDGYDAKLNKFRNE